MGRPGPRTRASVRRSNPALIGQGDMSVSIRSKLPPASDSVSSASCPLPAQDNGVAGGLHGLAQCSEGQLILVHQQQAAPGRRPGRQVRRQAGHRLTAANGGLEGLVAGVSSAGATCRPVPRQRLTVFLPPDLAWYIALSAQNTSAPPSAASDGNSATPMLTVMVTRLLGNGKAAIVRAQALGDHRRAEAVGLRQDRPRTPRRRSVRADPRPGCTTLSEAGDAPPADGRPQGARSGRYIA